MNRRRVFAGLAVLLGVVLSLVLAEGAAHLYVRFVAEKPRLFQPDSVLGWRPIPGLDVRRRNPDGGTWRVRTNAAGHRSPSETFRADAARRILVLGDSFAFGQGVELEDRFDSLVAGARPGWSLLNQGVMGYGTDQQLIGAREAIRSLRPGDAIVLLTSRNDFDDLLRQSHSGRAKPWFELAGDELREHPPRLGLLEWLRDRSYLAARVALLDTSRRRFSAEELRAAGALYSTLVVQETAQALGREIHVLIAHHGTRSFITRSGDRAERLIWRTIARLCAATPIHCEPLDLALMGSPANPYQSDGHWNALGNAAVAEVLTRALDDLFASSP